MKERPRKNGEVIEIKPVTWKETPPSPRLKRTTRTRGEKRRHVEHRTIDTRPRFDVSTSSRALYSLPYSLLLQPLFLPVPFSPFRPPSLLLFSYYSISFHSTSWSCSRNVSGSFSRADTYIRTYVLTFVRTLRVSKKFPRINQRSYKYDDRKVGADESDAKRRNASAGS